MRHLLFTCLSAMLLFTACTKDDTKVEEYCPDIYLGTFPMKDTSLTLMHYTQSQVLFFRDGLGNRRELKVINATAQPGYGTYKEKIPCEYDATYERLNTAQFQCWLASIQTSDQSLTFQYFLKCNPQNDDPVRFSDELSLSMIRDPHFISTIRAIHLIVDPRNQTDDYLMRFNHSGSSVTLLGETFQNVYASSDSGLYLTLTQGMVAFRDLTNTLWVLE